LDGYSILCLVFKNKESHRPHGTPFFGHPSWSLSPMASIERTAYPRFKSKRSRIVQNSMVALS
jgi:hypothetical protein